MTTDYTPLTHLHFALAATDEREVELFWKRFLREYQVVCSELDDPNWVAATSDAVEDIAHDTP